MSAFLGIPKVSDRVPREYRQLLVSLRHNVSLLTGDSTEIEQAPLSVSSQTSQATPIPSGTPQRIQSFVAESKPLAVRLSWAQPGSNVFLVVIRRSASTNLLTSVPIGVSYGRAFTDYIGGPSLAFNYWAVGINTNGQLGQASVRAQGSSGEITDTELGERTIDDSETPVVDTEGLQLLLSYLANRLRAITGEDDWKDDPVLSLLGLNQVVDNLIEEVDEDIKNIDLAIQSLELQSVGSRLYLHENYR